MMPYTAMAEIAKANRTPTGGSANCKRVSCPNRVTMPALPSRKSPPNGMIANARNAGTNMRYGARRKTRRSARSGMRSSLKKSFVPSAKVCNKPHGPALFGPTRFCMPAITLRSNHTINIVATRPTTKTTRTLIRTINRGVHKRPPSNRGSIANNDDITSTRF